jgi:hypothetical protein
MANSVAMKLGFSHVPWYTLTLVVLAIYTLLTLMVLFYRTDFINLTICVVAIYMMNNTERISRWTFRILVLAIFFSMVADFVYFILKDGSSGGKSGDGGIEDTIRSFSQTMSYISFFFRVSFPFSIITLLIF